MHLHKLSHGSKVMVLGRKVSPENDQSYQKIVEIEKRTLDTAQKFIEVNIKKFLSQLILFSGCPKLCKKSFCSFELTPVPLKKIATCNWIKEYLDKEL